MIIYVDENMSPFLARGFNILQEPLNHKSGEKTPVLSIKDTFGQGVRDEDWIPKAGQQGACVITQDYNIQHIKHQHALCQQYGLGMFYFRPPSKKGFSYWDMVKLMIKHWEEILKIVAREERPFAYRVSQRGKGLEAMD